MQSSNPAMQVISRTAGFNFGGQAAAATIEGTTTKSLLLIVVTFLVGMISMNYTTSAINVGNASLSNILMIGGTIAALIVALITIFKPTASPITAPLYAIAEGVALGSISAVFEMKYPGIVSSAVFATFATVVAMAAAWKFRIIIPTAKFRSIVVGATLGIAVLYLVNMVVSLFGGNLIPNSGPLSILISAVVCIVAAFNLILDFDNIENSVNQGLPKYFEYFNAFSLLVTICWLYIEILRLLAKIRQE